MNAIFKRTSIRKYEEKAVESEKIELLLKAAMAAPSACNQQPWEFYVVRNKEMIEKRYLSLIKSLEFKIFTSPFKPQVLTILPTKTLLI